jgi:hypothetical protein
LELRGAYGISYLDQEERLIEWIDSSKIPESDIQGVVANYTICEKSRDGIMGLLRRREDIARILSQSVAPIRRVFGVDQVPLVQIVCDPDSDGDWQLFAVIQFRGTPESGEELMRVFRADWWSKQSRLLRRSLGFGMDFV